MRTPLAVLTGLLTTALAAGVVAAPTPMPGPAGESAADVARPGPGAVPYSGRFTFVRLRFEANGPGMGYTPPWAHDYPKAERNLMRILDEVSLLGPRTADTNILEVGDPDLFKYPVAYICEPGFWSPTDREVEALRAYLLKGGFLIVDDFRGGEINHFTTQMRRVLPGVELVEMELSHPVFRSFFQVESLEFTAPTFRRFEPVFYGIFEDNDPTRRLLAVVNYNNDIGDYWEFSDVGWMPVELSNEAYKLGVNYIMYAMMN